jgi:uncharacterized protein YukE
VSVLGGNIEQLQQLRSQLVNESQNVEALRSRLTQLLGDTYWQGPAADRFKSDWNGQYSQTLRNLSQVLTDLSAEVQRRTDALIEVSR